MVLSPEPNRLAISRQLAVDTQRMLIEGRAQGLECETGDIGLGQVAAQQVHQQRGDQRAVDHQPGIALDASDVAPVVMDAVAIEGQRRVAEQQHIVGQHGAAEVGVAGRSHGCGFGIAGLLGGAVDDVVELGDRRRRAAVATQFMPHLDEHQRAAAAGLDAHVGDGRDALDRITHPDRRMEFQLAAGPHPSRQGHRRQEATALGVAVLAYIALPVHRQKVQPMPEVGQRRADLDVAGWMVQGRGQRHHRRGTDLVVEGFGTADPGGQVLGVGGHARLQRSPVWGGCQRHQADGVSGWWPLP